MTLKCFRRSFHGSPWVGLDPLQERSQARWFGVGLSDELGVSRAALGWGWSEDELLKDEEKVSNHLEALEKGHARA